MAKHFLEYLIWQKLRLYGRKGQWDETLYKNWYLVSSNPFWHCTPIWSSSENSNKRTSTLDHWTCPLSISQKVGCGRAKQQVKKAERKDEFRDTLVLS